MIFPAGGKKGVLGQAKATDSSFSSKKKRKSVGHKKKRGGEAFGEGKKAEAFSSPLQNQVRQRSREGASL